MPDFSIRLISIAESADRAARVAVETHTAAVNPHPAGSDDAKWWHDHYVDGLIFYSTRREGLVTMAGEAD